ncbi:hypothetical protein BP6252_09426 [Coleophoma cylindrospora]|uniref:HpcH/HpaI aldolase/citrate lyase domain-containing protein n=1 Tax=Coleophoma cylindrospora TaxID=1849047 RepID=A0A3D8R257_9HELO|nr:hypothetical protein BP6252_09426 [Coleophoma cylindrospora]
MATNDIGSEKWTYKATEPVGMQVYRAPSLLQPHRARDAIQDAHKGLIPPLVGFFCGLSCPPVAKVVAQLGYDVVFIDWEHASTDVETMTQMVHDIQFISEGKSMAFVRVPGHDHASIGHVLDAGASIIVPQVDTVEQAKHIVSASKFGARINGKRSAPPFRLLRGISDVPIDSSLSLWENFNYQAAVVIEIESVEGIRNLDAILTEVGDQIDSVWLGTLDARISMGLQNGYGEEPEWLEVKALYESTLRKHNMPASGLALGPPEIRAKMAKGKSFMVSTSDVYALLGETVGLADMRQSFAQMNYEQVYERI